MNRYVVIAIAALIIIGLLAAAVWGPVSEAVFGQSAGDFTVQTLKDRGITAKHMLSPEKYGTVALIKVPKKDPNDKQDTGSWKVVNRSKTEVRCFYVIENNGRYLATSQFPCPTDTVIADGTVFSIASDVANPDFELTQP